jgi:hypothetical protein
MPQVFPKCAIGFLLEQTISCSKSLKKARSLTFYIFKPVLSTGVAEKE